MSTVSVFFLWFALCILIVVCLVYDSSTLEPMENRAEPPSDDKVKAFDSSVIINRTRLTPCDQIITLYTLYPPTKHKSVYSQQANGCERYSRWFCCCWKHNKWIWHFRPFAVVPIPSSNLILLVAENWCPGASDPHFKITTTPFEHEYNNESLACYRSTVYMRRRRPTSCINRHANVSVLIA